MKKEDFIGLLAIIGIDQKFIEQMASSTGLIIRKRAIAPAELLYSICMESTKGTASYNDIASHIEAGCGASVSRQAIWKKVTEPCLDFFKAVLEQVILIKIKSQEASHLKFNSPYKRIIVQDSTIIKLPARLFELYSGVSNGHCKVCNARIQGTYDILNEEFVAFSIDPYSKNDSSAAPELELKGGDLTLRDRGYLTNGEVQRHYDANAHCVYRYRFGIALLNIIDGAPIDLIGILRKDNCIDMKVKLNNEKRTIVRIVAQPVGDKIASDRRRKAKKEKKRRPQKNIWRCSHGQYL